MRPGLWRTLQRAAVGFSPQMFVWSAGLLIPQRARRIDARSLNRRNDAGTKRDHKEK